MRLAEHLMALGASRLVHAISAWSVKTRHAPSRHSRDARGYGHMTTAMHEYRVQPPPPFPPPPLSTFYLLLSDPQTMLAAAEKEKQGVIASAAASFSEFMHKVFF